MSSNTKIVVLRSKELVYALVLLVVSVLIIMVVVSLFMPSGDSAANPSAPAQNVEESSSTESSESDAAATDIPSLYVPGIYSSTLLLGSSNVELQITVDKDHINSISMTNIDESIATLYPLMSPTLDNLSAAILEQQSLDNISYTEENRYTSMLLMQAITATLDKARVSENVETLDSDIVY